MLNDYNCSELCIHIMFLYHYVMYRYMLFQCQGINNSEVDYLGRFIFFFCSFHIKIRQWHFLSCWNQIVVGGKNKLELVATKTNEV